MVFRKLIFLIFLGVLFGNEIIVTADNFFADEKKLITILNGNVTIKRGKNDTLFAQKAKIFLNKDKKPIKYEARENANFRVTIENKNYEGKADFLSYDPIKKLYTMKGNAFLHEISSNKKVYAQEIIVNQKKGTYEVKSNEKKPAKIIFKVEEK